LAEVKIANFIAPIHNLNRSVYLQMINFKAKKSKMIILSIL